MHKSQALVKSVSMCMSQVQMILILSRPAPSPLRGPACSLPHHPAPTLLLAKPAQGGSRGTASLLS